MKLAENEVENLRKEFDRMPEAVYPRVWIEQGEELLTHKHEWVVSDEAVDPIDAPPRLKKAFSDAHVHGDTKKIIVGSKH
jgi:hypothetical protein